MRSQASDLPGNAEEAVRTAPSWRLVLEEVLASRRRCWLRGQVLPQELTLSAAVPSVSGTVSEREENKPQTRRSGYRPAGPSRAQLEVHVSNQRWQTEVAIARDGRFEALLEGTLSFPRRGWRLARCHLTWQGNTLDSCALVVLPPAAVRQAVVVLLPMNDTFSVSEEIIPAGSETAPPAAVLRVLLSQQALVNVPLYYLAVTPPALTPRRLAVRLVRRGWPAGQLLLFPTETPTLAGLFQGLDHLRWLFADSLELYIYYTEKQIRELLPAALLPVPDRAPVRECREIPSYYPSFPDSESSHLHLRPSRAQRVTRHPVVFCHGLLAFSTLHGQLPREWNSFSSLRELLQQRGFRVLFPQVGPTSSVAHRAQQLREQICRWTQEPINLIAHSMGGLDARYLITHLGMAERVRSLTTIATPHHGTWLADWFLDNYRRRIPLLPALELLGLDLSGFADCRPAACAAFNARTPDAPGVRYFSFGGAVPLEQLHPLLRRPGSLLAAVEGPNDGMVSVASAHWGEYLGTLAADHFAQTPDAAFARPDTSFDAQGFYLHLLEELAYRGL
jgi:triacylglycerol lipase